MSPWAKSKG